MTNFHGSKRFALSLMISACLSAPCALGQQAPGGSFPPLQASAAMTLYHVLTGANGQQYYLNQYGQAIPLPGAGTGDPQGVAIYTGTGGESWYVDKNGQQVDLPPLTVTPSYGQSPYYSAPPQTAYQQPQQQPNINITNETPPSSSGGSGSAGAALAAGLGAAAGAFGGAAMDMAMGGIPYGMPIYPGYGGGAPYYMGPDGNQVSVNKTVNNNMINNWNKQNNWYNQQVNNKNGRYSNNNWPGREHGFPPPGQQIPGRLYQPSPGGGAESGRLANRSAGGGGGWGHSFFGGGHMGGEHFGGSGFGHFGGGGFGGFGRR